MRSVLLAIIITTSFFIKGDLFSQHIQLSASALDDLEIIVLYDNYVCEKGTKGDWGFSCLIEAENQRILFDTGAKPEILRNNVETIGTNLSEIDQVFITHNHWDHTGGLDFVLEMNPNIPVYLPYPPDGDLMKKVGETEAIVKGGEKGFKLTEHMWSSGTMSGSFAEQCLVVQHQKGLVVITGCSHPGISKMLNQIKKEFGQNIYAVLGGFHLMQHSENQIDAIISVFRQLGVQKCGSTHCTGDSQIQQFREAFGEDFIEMGTGRKLVI